LITVIKSVFSASLLQQCHMTENHLQKSL